MGQTVAEKLSQAHLARPISRPVRAGDFVSIRPRHVLTHDNTAPVIEKFLAFGGGPLADPAQPVFVLDHDIQNRTEENLSKYRAIEAFAREQGIAFHPAGSGIGHQVMIEQLYVLPGGFVVASDSHANMYGAVGALGTPVVRTDAAAIWATGSFWWQIPPTIQVRLEGRLTPPAQGKDVILTLCARHAGDEVLNTVLEFGGPGIASLDMEARLTIANMTTEWGALAGWFPVDETTLEFLARRRREVSAERAAPVSEVALRAWRERPPAPDEDAVYAGRITLDLSTVTPHVTGPDTTDAAVPLEEIERQRLPIQKAYIVSCVNARVGDLASAAEAIRGQRVAAGVELFIAAASREVEQEATRLGHWQTLLEAGARPLPPGCGPCIGSGAGLLEPGEVGISATNRNFKGRMGSRDARCYLANPAVVAASAAAGYITGPRGPSRPAVVSHFERLAAPPAPVERVEIEPGFPQRIRGRLVFVPRDRLDTDGIYGREWVYRDATTPERMAQVVFENYDPSFAAQVRSGDVLVGGTSFGTGSSREQAVTALLAKGIPLVIASSFAATYLRNAFNNGLPCSTCPELVDHLRAVFREEIARDIKTLVPGDELSVDFERATIAFRERTFNFTPLGAVAQSLVAAGGIANLLRSRGRN